MALCDLEPVSYPSVSWFPTGTKVVIKSAIFYRLIGLKEPTHTCDILGLVAVTQATIGKALLGWLRWPVLTRLSRMQRSAGMNAKIWGSSKSGAPGQQSRFTISL